MTCARDTKRALQGARVMAREWKIQEKVQGLRLVPWTKGCCKGVALSMLTAALQREQNLDMAQCTGPDRWITVQTMRDHLAIQKDLCVLTWKVVQAI